MYRLFQSDDLQSLVNEHRRLLSRPLGGEATLLVVQSGPMQRWLGKYLASRNGIWLAPDMATPDQALRSLLIDTERPPESRNRTAIYMDDLKLLCFQTLRDISGRSAYERPLRDLYDRIGLPRELPQGSPRLLRTVYGIADALAGLLYAYAQNFFDDPRLPGSRAHIFDLWNEGTLVTQKLEGTSRGFRDLVTRHETWQRDLYRIMFPEERIYDILGYQTHRAVVEDWRYTGPYKRIVLFGSAFLSAQAFAFFRSMAREMEVVHCLFTPGESLAVPQTGIAKEITGDTIAAWSELLSTFINEAGQLETDKLFGATWLPGGFDKKTQKPGALNTLQDIIGGKSSDSLKKTGVRERSTSQATAQAGSPGTQLEFDIGTPGESDDSLRFIDCTTPLREVQALKQRILKLMSERNAESGETLLLTDIAVMAPDIRLYRPFIETVFGSLDENGQPLPDHLPHNIVDLSFGEGSSVVSALENILELDTNRLERSSLFALLDNEAVGAAAGIDQSDVELFRKWADEMEARWGMNADHRDELQTGHVWQNTWDRAFARFIEGGISGMIPAARVDTGRIALVMQWLHGVFNVVRDMTRATMNIETWTGRFRIFLDQFLAAPDEAETGTMDRIRGILANLNTSYKNLSGEKTSNTALSAPIDWYGFKTLFRDQLSHLSASRGQHQVDGIVCSSIRPYRAIPFKLIAVLGMNEGDFPRPDDIVSFDLSGLPGQTIAQVNNQVQDSYAWIETISSAREYFWVFFQGRDPSSGETLSPSSLVDDTLDLLREHAGIDPLSLRSRERVSAFDRDYFDPAGPENDLWNLSASDLTIAKAMYQGPAPTSGTRNAEPKRGLDPGWVANAAAPGLVPTESTGDALTLRFSDLRDFLVYPLKSAFNHKLGIWIKEDRDPAGEDREPLDPGNSQFRVASERFLDAFWRENGQVSAKLAEELGESWFAADELVEGPGSSFLVDGLGSFLDGLAKELAEKLRGLAPGSTELSNWQPAPPVALDIALSPTSVVRVEAELGDYYLHPSGAGLVLIKGKKPVVAGSGLTISQLAQTAVISSLAEAAGLPRPSFLAVIPTVPRTIEKAYLKIFDIPREPCFPLETLVGAHLANLENPFPLYGSISTRIIKNLVADNALENRGKALGLTREAWDGFWDEPDEANSFSKEWPPDNPFNCPYFRRAWPEDNTGLPWREWYGPAFLDIWEPFARFRESFKSRSDLYKTKKAKA